MRSALGSVEMSLIPWVEGAGKGRGEVQRAFGKIGVGRGLGGGLFEEALVWRV